jgi:hypothetical protein
MVQTYSSSNFSLQSELTPFKVIMIQERSYQSYLDITIKKFDVGGVSFTRLEPDISFFQTDDDLVSSQTFGSFFSDYQQLMTNLDGTDWWQTWYWSLPCEAYSVVCTRIDDLTFDIMSFQYSSDRSWNYQCNENITVPSSFWSIVSMNISYTNCLSSLEFDGVFPNLLSLDLSAAGLDGARFFAQDFSYSLPALENLILKGNNFGQMTYLGLSLPSSIIHLDLSSTSIRFVPVDSNSPLKSISLSLGTTGLDLSQLPLGIVNVSIQSRAINGTVLNLTSYGSLLTFDAWGAKFDQNVIFHFPLSLAVLKLDMEQGNVRPFSPPLNQLVNLRALWIGGQRFTHSSQILTALTDLEEVYLDECNYDSSLSSWMPPNVVSLTLESSSALSLSTNFDLSPYLSLRELRAHWTDFPRYDVNFKFPSSIQSIYIDSCNLHYMNGLSSSRLSLESLALYWMEMYDSSSMQGIVFQKLKSAYLIGLSLTELPDSFAVLSKSVEEVWFRNMGVNALSNKFFYPENPLGDHILFAAFDWTAAYNLPRFNNSSSLIVFSAPGFTFHHFLNLSDVQKTLPPSIEVRLNRLEI